MIVKVPYDPPNWNEYIKLERGHWGASNALKQREKQIMQYVCHGKKWDGGYPIEIIVRPHFKEKRKDLDNTRIKGLIDGMVECGFIDNDNLTKIQKITYVPVFDNEKCIEFEIKELSE